MQIAADYSVSFDLNVATYLRSWMLGNDNDCVGMLQEVIRTLRNGRINWDLMPYLVERSEDILEGKDLQQILETLHASSWFAAMDRLAFVRSEAVRIAVPSSNIERKAQEELTGWEQTLRSGTIDEIRDRFGLFHACVPKMVALELGNPGRRAALKKFESFLNFLNDDVSCMSLLMIRAAFEFFTRGGAFKPMKKVGTVSPNLLQNIRNVTWDFLHLQWRQKYAGLNGRWMRVLKGEPNDCNIPAFPFIPSRPNSDYRVRERSIAS